MSELHNDGSPIFVDVSSNPQFPILCSQLIQPQDANTQNIMSKDSNAPGKRDKTAPGLQADQTLETNTTNTCIKIEKHCLTCPECKKFTCETEEKMLKHIRQVHVSSCIRLQADQTSETSASNACIKIEKRRLKCPECKRFTCETEEKMMRHIRRVHRGENPFQCAMCEYSTYNKAVFEEHVRVHQGIKPFKCSFCNYRSASKKNVKKHELIHRSDNPLKCQDCDFIGRNSASYNAHRTKIHMVKVPDDPNKTYSCNLCKRQFQDKRKKHNHNKNKLHCSSCAYVACSKALMTKHVQFDHEGSPELKKESVNVFTCALCPWSSNSKPRILLHLIHHPNQTVDENLVDITVLRKYDIMK